MLFPHSHDLVFPADVLVRLVRQHRGRRDADNRAGQDVRGNPVSGVVVREQGGSDQRRGTTHRGELLAQRSAAIATTDDVAVEGATNEIAKGQAPLISRRHAAFSRSIRLAVFAHAGVVHLDIHASLTPCRVFAVGSKAALPNGCGP